MTSLTNRLGRIPWFTWDPYDPEQWDFEHGPSFDDWLSRTGTYDPGWYIGNNGSSIHVWLRAVPAIAWIDDHTVDSWNNDDTADSWLNDYLYGIRLIVVDRWGARRPCPGDPREERTCETLVEFVMPKAAPVEEALGLLVDLENDVGWDVKTPEVVMAEARWLQLHEEVERFLEMRDLGDGRCVVAFGQGASFSQDYNTLQRGSM
jgi:hypothetical protein